MTTESFAATPQYLISGTGPYPVQHAYSRAEDLIVYHRGATGTMGLISPLDYTLNPAGPANAGNLTLLAAAATTYAGGSMIILRRTLVEQGWQGQNAREVGLMIEIDRTARAAQDLRSDLNRTPGLRDDFVGPRPKMPAPTAGFTLVGDGTDFVRGPSVADITAAQANAAALALLSAIATELTDVWIGTGTVGPFALSVDPVLASRVRVLDPVQQEAGLDYSIVTMATAPSGKGILFVVAPVVGQRIRAQYGVPANYSAGNDVLRSFAARTDMIAAVATLSTLASGVLVSAAGLIYRRVTGSTVIPDFLGFVPDTAWDFGHFGAVGDDLFDNTAAFQAGLNAAPGNPIALSKGVYRHGPLTVPSEVTVCGTGTFKPLASISNTVPVFTNSVISAVSGVRTNTNIKFVGVTFDGSLRVPTRWLSTLSGVAISNPEADYVVGTGALASGITAPTFTASISGGAVTSVAVNTGGAGFKTHATVPYLPADVQLSFSGGGGYGATGYGVITGGAITSVVMTNGGWDYTSSPTVTTRGGHANIDLLAQPAVNRRNPNHAQNSILLDLVKVNGGGVFNCTFIEYPFMAIADRGCLGMSYENNVFVGSGPAEGALPCIWVESHGSPNAPPVFFQDCENVSIVGNTFKNLLRPAIQFSPTKGGICSDNVINIGKEVGIFLPASTCKNGGRVTVENNFIENIVCADLVANGIELNGGARNVRLINNHIVATDGAAVQMAGAVDCTLTGSYIENCGGTISARKYGPIAEGYSFNNTSRPVAGEPLIQPVVNIGQQIGIASHRIRIEDNTFRETRAGLVLRTFLRQVRSGAVPPALSSAHRVIGNFVDMPAGVVLYDDGLLDVFADADSLIMRDNPGFSQWNLREDVAGNLIERRVAGSGTKFTVSPVVKDTLSRAISTLNLKTGHRLLLDAGDATSYTTGQVWADVSGSGNNYNRGTTTGADATDPTFNGVAGDLSDREFFSSDGADYFTPAGVPTFGANWHRSTAKFTFAAVINPPAAGTSWRLISTMNTNATDTGILLSLTATNLLQFLVYNAGVIVANIFHTIPLVAGADQFVALSIDASLPKGAAIMQIGALRQQPNGAYTSPSAAAATGLATLLAGTTGAGAAAANARLGFAAAWDTVALSAAQIDQLYYAARTRWTGL